MDRFEIYTQACINLFEPSTQPTQRSGNVAYYDNINHLFLGFCLFLDSGPSIKPVSVAIPASGSC